jgi:hypothetical protein
MPPRESFIYIDPPSSWTEYFDVVIPALHEKPISIRFADVIEKHFFTIARHEYSEEESKNWFYTSEELCRNDEEQEKIMRQMYQQKRNRFRAINQDENVDSYRGLEKSEKKAKHINRCIDAVLDEQDFQCKTRTFDWEGIAQVSRRISKRSSKMALKLAREDARDARKVYKE